jgi:hypothetical protein
MLHGSARRGKQRRLCAGSFNSGDDSEKEQIACASGNEANLC